MWILWRLDCEDCAELFETIAPIEWGIRPLVLVELPLPPEKLEGPPHVKALPEGDHVHRVRLPEGTEFLGTTPMVLVVHGGCVIFARDGMKAADWEQTQSPEIPEGCR